MLNWGGLMRRKISCKVVKSKLLDDNLSYAQGFLNRFTNRTSIFNSDDFTSGSIIYTKHLNTTTVQTKDNTTENLLDYYA